MTTTPHVFLSDLHFEHRLWTNELSFFSDELRIYEKRLGVLIQRPLDKGTLSELEQFQNQFIRHKEVIEELNHDIREYEHSLSEYAEEHPIAVDHVYFRDHDGLRDRMNQFKQIYQNLKDRFMTFLQKNL